MIVEPLSGSRWRPWALLFGGHRRLVVTTAAGESSAEGRRAVEKALAELTGHQCYVTAGLSGLRHSTGALSWSMDTWRGRETGITHIPTGVRVTSLRGALAGSTDVPSDLDAVLTWLRGYGVAPGSISGMSWSLWRASLGGPVRIGFNPDVGRAALYGGRQEIREPRTYQHMVSADIRAAYPVAMASRDYAVGLREVDLTTRIDPEVPGIASARVYVPVDMPFAPLPVRLAPAMIQFQTGYIEGTWPWCELAAAADLGAEVTITRCWAPRSLADLFGPWWELAATGRDLPGAAGVLTKAICNSLWGQFAMEGCDRSAVHWTDDKGRTPFHVERPAVKMPHRWAAHIAAETTARVRSRLLTEGLYGGGAPPVHVDTDGMIVRRRRPPPRASGHRLGEWRVKDRMPKVEIRAPQLYRYTCGAGCGVTHPRWHYVAAGVPEREAPEVFRHTPPMTISYRAVFDTCLPPGHAADQEGQAGAMILAKAVGT